MVKSDFPSSRFLVCLLYTMLFKQTITNITQDFQEPFHSFDQPPLISKLAEVWKNRFEHLGHKNKPLFSMQGGGGATWQFSAKVWNWTIRFKF